MSKYIGQEPRRYNLTSQSYTVASGGVTSFTLDYNPGSPQSILVHVNGVFARPNESYGVVGKTITFSYTLTLGDVVSVYYLGILNNTFPVATPDNAIRGASSGLLVSASGSSASVSITVKSISLENSFGQYFTAKDQALTLNMSATGLNGLDIAPLTGSTWYYLFVISDGTNVAALASLSSTTPTLPGSYTYFARVGSVRTDASGSMYPLGFTQKGRVVSLKIGSANVVVPPQLASGAAGTYSSSVYSPVAVSVINFVPATASKIRVGLSATATGVIMGASANDSRSGWQTYNPPELGVNTTNVPYNPYGDILLESTNIYWATSGGTAGMFCAGWEDAL